METKPRFRSFLAVSAGIALLLLVVSPAMTRSVRAQDPGDAGAEEGKSTGEEAASDVPPIPPWSPTDPAVKTVYDQARVDLDAGRFKEAERGFKKIRTKARGTDGEATIERCLREAEGGQFCEKAAKFAEKEQPRKILALWQKESEEIEGTFTGEALRGFYEEALADVFHILANFEKKKTDSDPSEKKDDEGDDPPAGGDARGSTEFGANSRLVQGKPEEGEIRQGEGSLYWMTTKEIGSLTIRIPEDVDVEDYRYLRLSFRTEDPKAKPPIMVIFDCESGNLPGGGPQAGGRGGRRGNARQTNAIRNRIGFHSTVSPNARWQDLRLDLRKFEDRGNARWQNVLNLRIVHLGAGEPTGIFLDDLILEKE